MNPGPSEIVTPSLLRRHLVRGYGRMCLFALGSSAVFLVLFLLGWLLGSIVRGQELTVGMTIFAAGFAAVIYLWGFQKIRRDGPQDWEKIAQQPIRNPGMRLSRLSNLDPLQLGGGFIGLVLCGPGWLIAIYREWKDRIPSDEATALKLEKLRRDLAARADWVPVNDFSAHEKEIYQLAKLNLVAIREFAGQWFFHTTLEGSNKWSEDGAGRSEPE